MEKSAVFLLIGLVLQMVDISLSTYRSGCGTVKRDVHGDGSDSDNEYDCSGDDETNEEEFCSEALQCDAGQRIKIRPASNSALADSTVRRLKCKCDGLNQCDVQGSKMCSNGALDEKSVRYMCKFGALNCCDADVDDTTQLNNACDFQLTCDCCKQEDLTFGQCPGDGTVRFLGQNGKVYLDSAGPSSDDKDDDEATDEVPGLDEDGCHLRVVKYKGKVLCVPGVMAQMLKRISRITKNQNLGTCHGVFEPGCTGALRSKQQYHFKVNLTPKNQSSREILLTQIKRCRAGQGADELICRV